jgi:hypothetical protein
MKCHALVLKGINFEGQKLIFNLVQNIINHVTHSTQASNVIFNCTRTARHLHIHYSDNGKDFNNKEITDSFELTQMKRNITDYEGTLNIQTKSNKGTELKIALPLDKLTD